MSQRTGKDFLRSNWEDLRRQALEIPVTRVAEDLGFEFDRKERRYRKDGIQVVIASDRVWRKCAHRKAFKSYGSGPEMKGAGAIDFVMAYFGWDFFTALGYLCDTYHLTSEPFVAPRGPKAYVPGRTLIEGDPTFPRGGDRPKRILALVDPDWLSAGAIALAGGFHWARNQWLANPHRLEAWTEYEQDGVTVTILPVLDRSGRSYLLDRDKANTWVSDIAERTRKEKGSIHLSAHVWWPDIEGIASFLDEISQGVSDQCRLYWYNPPVPKLVAPPPAHDRLWPEVAEYLIETRGIDEGIVMDCHKRGYLYATEGWKREKGYLPIGCGAVFVTRTADGHPTGAVVRCTRPTAGIPKRTMEGMDRDAGYFWRFVRGEGIRPPSLFIGEAPIEVLSAETIARRNGLPLDNLLFLSKSGEGGNRPVQVRMARVLAAGGEVVVGFNQDPHGAGIVMMQRLCRPFQKEVSECKIRLCVPDSEKDWNDVLRSMREFDKCHL